ERALLDSIELWIIPSPAEQDFHLRLEYGNQRGATMQQSACTYLLLSPRSVRVAAGQRLPLMRFLAEPHPVADCDERAPALGVLSGCLFEPRDVSAGRVQPRLGPGGTRRGAEGQACRVAFRGGGDIWPRKYPLPARRAAPAMKIHHPRSGFK
ncbi:hypothetical protein AA0N74_18970, partial [Chromobacterium vaccinii]|uniref:hypothetical protein n=1 Tax=Chromobacterium vaccinii TaxID=1108595 RepID=UPI0031DAC6A7